MNRIENRFKIEWNQKRNRLQFYIGNPFGNKSDQNKVNQKIEIAFNLYEKSL